LCVTSYSGRKLPSMVFSNHLGGANLPKWRMHDDSV